MERRGPSTSQGDAAVTISDEYAAELVAKMRADLERRDELTAEAPVDNRDLLLLKLYDDLQALKKGTAFLGVGSGIPPVRKVAG